MDTQKLIEFAQDTARIHNERSAYITRNHPEYVDTLEFTGIIQANPAIFELLPNEHNSGLMDSARIVRYSAEFTQRYRKIGGKRIMTFKYWYYCGQDIERLEIGAYYDNR